MAHFTVYKEKGIHIAFVDSPFLVCPMLNKIADFIINTFLINNIRVFFIYEILHLKYEIIDIIKPFSLRVSYQVLKSKKVRENFKFDILSK